MKVVQVEDGFGIDVVRCPLADYFHSLELSELCDGTSCELDFRTTELAGVKLARTETLSRGNDKCNFRYFHLNHGKDDKTSKIKGGKRDE